jgi:1-acyl-sn-glycerol-3-phosphate acyltransferase
MIAVRRNAGFERCFSAYLYWLVRRSFQTVWLRTSAALPHGGFVAAANHTSWWDGFVPFLIHRKLTPHSPFFILMSETELRRFAFFRWGGAFSIDAASKRKALESIRYAAEAVREGGGVWIFPQGSLTPAGSSLRFTSGFVHAARGGSGPIVPVALRFAMLSAQRPEAFVDFGPAIDPRHRDALVTTREIVASMVSEIDRHIFEGTVTSRFEPFIHGGRGVDESVSVLTAPYGRRL